MKGVMAGALLTLLCTGPSAATTWVYEVLNSDGSPYMYDSFTGIGNKVLAELRFTTHGEDRVEEKREGCLFDDGTFGPGVYYTLERNPAGSIVSLSKRYVRIEEVQQIDPSLYERSDLLNAWTYRTLAGSGEIRTVRIDEKGVTVQDRTASVPELRPVDLVAGWEEEIMSSQRFHELLATLRVTGALPSPAEAFTIATIMNDSFVYLSATVSGFSREMVDTGLGPLDTYRIECTVHLPFVMSVLAGITGKRPRFSIWVQREEDVMVQVETQKRRLRLYAIRDGGGEP